MARDLVDTIFRLGPGEGPDVCLCHSGTRLRISCISLYRRRLQRYPHFLPVSREIVRLFSRLFDTQFKSSRRRPCERQIHRAVPTRTELSDVRKIGLRRDGSGIGLGVPEAHTCALQGFPSGTNVYRVDKGAVIGYSSWACSVSWVFRCGARFGWTFPFVFA